jgi:hypothetical protein
MSDLYRIDVPHFVAGVVVRDQVVVQAAPILAWTVGKRLGVLGRWVASKGGTLVKVTPKARP